MALHTKQKGSIGEAKVVADLIARGYPVFVEFGDNSKVDLIALVGDRPIRIQVKAYATKNEKVELKVEKHGPNYRFSYVATDFDILAVYVPDKEVILYMEAAVFCSQRTHSLRFSPVTRKEDQEKARYAADYLSFDEALAGVANVGFVTAF